VEIKDSDDEKQGIFDLINVEFRNNLFF